MTSDPFYLGAYWGPRSEPVQVCARRLTRCLESLGTVSEILGSWYLTGHTLQAAQRYPVAIEASALVDVLLAGQNRRDADKSVITELGYSASVWNGNAKAPAGVRVTCGAYTTAPGLVSNTFVLDLPAPDQASALYEPVLARKLMQAVVDAWEPDWAVLVSDSLRDAQQPRPRQPVIGWMTYLSSCQGTFPTLPNGVLAESMGKGTLILFDERPCVLTAPKVQELAALLDDAGCLQPTS
ncbi:MAG: Imm52 family immunity protein [Egibacteraceae bacterium]